jgi:hypothetical protein
MKTIKSFDLAAQLFLITGGVLLCLLRPDHFYIAYFLVGGWQVLSCLAHLFYPHYYPYSGRKSYLWVLLFVIFVGLICLLIPESIISYLFCLLIFSPIMAVWYAFVCYKEVKLYQQKEWIQLK